MALKMPSVNIAFYEKGITAIQRSERGIVAMILEDDVAKHKTPYKLYTVADIPTTLSLENQEQIELAMKGYQKAPLHVLVFVIAKGSSDGGSTSKYEDVLKTLETTRFDYLVVPQATDTDYFATWIKQQRTVKDKMVKAVLYNQAADFDGVVNFTNTSISVVDDVATAAALEAARKKGVNTVDNVLKTMTGAQYASRIAGIICGTPMTIACTYAPLPEVMDVDRYTKDEMDEKTGNGELFIFYDGKKFKINRGVNSFVTTTQDKLDSFKKIKKVDIMDMIHDDIKDTAQDSYIGKYANSYANKCLLIAAILGYLERLELDGLLQPGSSVELDIEYTKNWLLSNGKKTKEELNEMTEQEIKEADTNDVVFLIAKIKILDAIEEINLRIMI